MRPCLVATAGAQSTMGRPIASQRARLMCLGARARGMCAMATAASRQRMSATAVEEHDGVRIILARASHSPSDAPYGWWR